MRRTSLNTISKTIPLAASMDAEKSDSNPFSFKTFLKRGEGPPPPASASKGTAKKGSGKKKGPGKKSQSDVPFPDSDDIGKYSFNGGGIFFPF